ncbi:hypothetical protein FE257_006771 [Aspergillus nanangensis]|uniref:Uncharacterized protein n=1 Tax=Aspergillus nanangensis TaxID=2582783 RepID=A0AAD4CNQ7_ASPNN|nr:hypothetical protein FE257_006771 [Aspergillus nanangensis]
MLLSPHHQSKSVHQDNDMAEDMDEPPDHRFLDTASMNVDDGLVYVKSPTAATDQKESLLTRALKSSPVLSPTEQSQDHAFCRSYPYSVSGVSTAELTSDGGLTSPSLSNTPSPPLPTHLNGKLPQARQSQKTATGQAGESVVEANLGRKRCISFACGRQAEESNPQQPPTPQRPIAQDRDNDPTPTAVPAKRKTVLTFVCPARDPEPRRERPQTRGVTLRSPRPRGSPAPISRRASPQKEVFIPSPSKEIPEIVDQQPVPTSGLGKFEESEATRFHEFASSVEEDDEWVTKSSDYKEKITLSDCMKKEIAIRKLAEEAEEEALEEEEDDEDDDNDDDDADDDSTVHDFSSDDGNESDNEAGFADSDDESDDGSEYQFWAPTSTTAATTPQTLDIPPPTLPRRDSNTSFDSGHDDRRRRWPPGLTGKAVSRPMKISKMRPSTPNLPDSTDFVCGTFDEDRPLEAAYKSCMEQRRLSKQIVIPQDIDPSFPTSDPEDEEDDEDLEDSVIIEEAPRGRTGGDPERKVSPLASPKRMVSPPPPRRHGRNSPRRLRSPPPPIKFKSPFKNEPISEDEAPGVNPRGLNISELVQRPHMTRTKSLPRTPNPFFSTGHRWSGIVPLRESPERESSRTREMHTRGPIDIVEGLEKKRQKRKEKFWRQHCRKAAKEQIQRRPIPGKGAERMKDLGLAVAERCRAYGVGDDVQLVLSV